MLKNTKTIFVNGFTLIELLVVVSVLAAMAGITSVAMDGYYQEAQEQVSLAEMGEISKAIRRFKHDTGYWPKTGPFSYSSAHTEVPNDQPNGLNPVTSYRDNYFNDPANFWWLFEQPRVHIGGWNAATDTDDDTPLWQWQNEASIGWKGPYLNFDSIKTVTRDIAVEQGCSSLSLSELQVIVDTPDNTYPDHIVQRFTGLMDRFEQVREKQTGENYCIISNKTLRILVEISPDVFEYQYINRWVLDEVSRSPYLYEVNFSHVKHPVCKADLADDSKSITCIVVRSFGADGIDGYKDPTDIIEVDDLVNVIKIN